MTDEKRLIIDDNSTKTTYDCKGYNAICMPCTYKEFTEFTFQGASAKGNTLYLNLQVCVGHEQEQDIFKTIKFTFKNYNDIETVYCWDKHYEREEVKNYITSPEYYDFVVGQLLVKNDNKGTITGSNFDDKVDLKDTTKVYTVSTANGNDTITLNNTFVDQNNSKKVTTVKAGAGANEVTVEGTGRNLITAGANSDTITFKEGSSTTTVKAGAGKNTININNNDFGNITVAEEKVKAENNIVISSLSDDYTFTKEGNDFIISNDDGSSLKINSLFATGKKLAKTTFFNEYTWNELLDEYHKGLTVIGSGTIKGTDYADTITSNDSKEGVNSKNDKIYAGKGDDSINAGAGKNSIYFYAGDGADTVKNGGGVDTLIFKKGSKLSFAHVKSETEGKYDLHICYNKNDNTDYVILKNMATFNNETLEYEYDFDSTSVAKLKVGSKTNKLEALLNRNKIENVLKKGAVSGTEKHDDIYVTDGKKFKDGKEIVITGSLGNDNIMIGSNSESTQGNQDGYNIDPAKYNTVDIKPTVYTHLKDTKDTTEGTYDKISSYAKGDGKYYAQSAISDIKVYGDGTNDTYNTYYDDQFTKLYDESGNDVLYIKDKTHSDLKLIFNVTNEYKDWSSEIAKIETITEANKNEVVGLMVNSLQEVKIVTSDDRNYFLENQEENNDIGIDIDYWGDKNAHDSEGDFDEKTEALLSLGKDKLTKFGGGVEKIYASDGSYITSDAIAQVASNVASWLTDKGYANVEEVRTAEKTEGDFTALLEVFDNIQWQNSNV